MPNSQLNDTICSSVQKLSSLSRRFAREFSGPVAKGSLLTVNIVCVDSNNLQQGVARWVGASMERICDRSLFNPATVRY